MNRRREEEEKMNKQQAKWKWHLDRAQCDLRTQRLIQLHRKATKLRHKQSMQLFGSCHGCIRHDMKTCAFELEETRI